VARPGAVADSQGTGRAVGMAALGAIALWGPQGLPPGADGWMALPRGITYPAVFLLGCVIGSFVNVCIYRMPRDRSVVTPPSHCPQCGARLGARELLPLVSFLALGRKCAHCGAPISWRYFVVELITGLVFVAAWEACYGGAFGLRLLGGADLGSAVCLGAQVVACWMFAVAMVALVFTDLDHMIIPDKLVVAALLAAVVSEAAQVAGRQSPLLSVSLPGTDLALPRVVAGGLLGMAVFVLVRAFSQLLFRREGMGLGDVKLAGAIGAMLGPAAALLSFGLAIFTGAVLGVLLMALRLRRRMEYLPFGPFLAASALVGLLAPQGLAHGAKALYLRWLAAIGVPPAF